MGIFGLASDHSSYLAFQVALKDIEEQVRRFCSEHNVGVGCISVCSVAIFIHGFQTCQLGCQLHIGHQMRSHHLHIVSQQG